MNSEQIKLLNKMKKLVRDGKFKFVDRKDRDHEEELFNIGISEYEAWYIHILYLKPFNYVVDNKPIYYRDNNSLVFKKTIKKKNVYIKLKIELNKYSQEECVCLSFHEDYRR
jgi:hypothetical protein